MTASALHLALAVLAVWRVCNMIAHEAGPFNVFYLLHNTLGSTFLTDELHWEGSNVLGDLIACPLCLSVWVAAPVALLFAQDPVQWVLYWLGISGGSSLITAVLNGLEST